ncbi:Redoxin-domain-containing protein [Hypomontagnella monticulosa]|nr:Redoxin-domain-containing protein [Hypomontagnella monticulosa]
MAFRAAFRRAPTKGLSSLAASASSRTTTIAARHFHASPRAFVKVGEQIPDLEVLQENSPGNMVNLAKEFQQVTNGVIVGVPAAFSGACSQTHVPGYIQHPKLKQAGQVFVVSVNDAFVMKAWADQLDPTHESGIRFLADPAGEFTKALDLGFDAPPIFGDKRSKRYAIVVENGKVKALHVEPDNTGTSVSLAENVLV